VVDDLIHRDGDEVEEHDLGDRPVADHRETDRSADDRLLGNGRRPDTARPELRRKALGDLEDAADRVRDILAEDDDLVVGGHRALQRRGHRTG
jgi:hypothetical protein